MQLRLWQRLFFAFAALSIVALVGFVAWQQSSFRRGFLAYLNEGARQRLDAASERIAARYREHGNWEFLRDDPAQFEELIDPAAGRRRPPSRSDFTAPPKRMPNAGPDHPPPPPRATNAENEHSPPPFDGNDPRGGKAPPPRDRSSNDWVPPGAGPMPDRLPPPPPDGRNPLELAQRVQLVDADQRPVVGHPVPQGAVSLPVVLDGARIGTLRLAPLPRLLGDLDVAFAAGQWRDALIAGIAILASALLLAFALARWLLAPIRALADGTRALAAGDYARRIVATRNDELGALASNFNDLAGALELHREQRRQWGADIAHEQRTPVSVLRGEIQALQDGVRAMTPEALNSLQAECDRLAALVEDLYQLALADAGALEYRFTEVDIGAIARDAGKRHAQIFADAGLALECAIAPCPQVRGDERRLTQLFDNLLANSRRYTDAPGRVRVEVARSNGSVRIVVDDSAPGVPATALPRLFERLFRVERSRNRCAGGAGLGLAICQAIVEAHGGSVAALASPLGGLRVCVKLPAAQQVAS